MLILHLTQYRRLCTGIGFSRLAISSSSWLLVWHANHADSNFLTHAMGIFQPSLSANFLVLKPFDKITSSRPWDSNTSHRTEAFIPDFMVTSLTLHSLVRMV